MERDYVLGTHDAEIERLGIQHRVWRGRMLEGWQRAGISVGQTVVDFGAGPGYASLDLAETVGPAGKVIALERSARFLEALGRSAAARGLDNIEGRQTDVVETGADAGSADAVWCRWLLSFVRDPAKVVSNIARTLKPGGVAIFHEYADYGAWRLAPPDERHDRFVSLVIESWRASGGDPDVALRLPSFLSASGMELVEIRPMIQVIEPADLMWEWPQSFTRVNAQRLREIGLIDAAEEKRLAGVIEEAGADPERRMVTPFVFEVIATR
jgi:SAM-dependent methyltransferase